MLNLICCVSQPSRPFTMAPSSPLKPASGAWSWNTAVTLQFPLTYCILVLEVWLQVRSAQTTIHQPWSICTGSQFNDPQGVAQIRLWISLPESNYCSRPGRRPNTSRASAYSLSLCVVGSLNWVSLHTALRWSHPRGVWMKIGEVPPSPRWVFSRHDYTLIVALFSKIHPPDCLGWFCALISAAECKIFPCKITFCSRWSKVPAGPVFKRALEFFFSSSPASWEQTSHLCSAYHLDNLVSGYVDGLIAARLSVGRDVWSPVCAIWLLFVYFSCNGPVFSTVSSTINAAFSGGFTVVANYRRRDWNRKADSLTRHLSHRCFFKSSQLLSGVTSQRCSRVFRSR